MNDTTPTPLSPDQLAWLRHAAALGQAEPQALLHLLERIEALEAAAATPQPDKIDRLAEAFRAEDEAGAALPEPAYLSDGEAINLFLGKGYDEGGAGCARRIHRAGWDAAMAAVIEQCMAAAEATPAPAPSAPPTLVQRLASLIAAFASTARIGADATPAAIDAVRHVAGWVHECTGDNPVYELLEEADRAAAELEGQSDG